MTEGGVVLRATGLAAGGLANVWQKGKPVLAAVAIVGLAALCWLAWRHLAPVRAADGWQYRVYLDQVSNVSALAIDEQGVLYVSEERSSERGLLFRLEADGSRSAVLQGLSKPDGMVVWQGGIAVGQEGGEYPVLWGARGGTFTALFAGRSVEGLASDGRYLYAIEDRRDDGRLLRFDATSRQLTVLRDGLHEGEGVAVCPDGQLFYTEKGRAWVKRWRAQGEDEIVLRGLRAPGFLMCNAEGLWITEDATHQARLLRLDRHGVLHVLLEGLRSAQTVLPLPAGRLLLAEQGRSRILLIERAHAGAN